ncbi:unnamed protein product [Absidia cylindrospora]
MAAMANTTTTHTTPLVSIPHDATITTTATTTNRTAAERTPQSPINGPKPGFLSLLFCCASDTSAWVNQGLSKQTPTLAIPSSKLGPATIQQQQQQQQQPHHLQGQSKRKKKHWFSRFYTAKQHTSQQQQQQQQRQAQQQPTSVPASSNDTSHVNDNIPVSPPPLTITPEDDKAENESTPPTPTTPTTSPPITVPPTTTDMDTDPTTTSAFEMTENGPMTWLLPPVSEEHIDRKCLVLDLDETLVHSSFRVIPNPDFVVPVEIDQQIHNVYVLKRPGVDEFMRKMGEKYEIVVFTASLSKYADPVLDKLDIHHVVKHRLFRESCFNHKGSYVKDLSQLGRDLAATLILDNSPTSYLFHNQCAVPVSTWFNDCHDTELLDLVDFLEDLATVDDVTLILDSTLHPPSPMTTK